MAAYPDVPEGLEEHISELHEKGDEAWAQGNKFSSDAYHSEARSLGVPYGLHVVKCDQCSVYMLARDLAEHKQRDHVK